MKCPCETCEAYEIWLESLSAQAAPHGKPGLAPGLRFALNTFRRMNAEEGGPVLGTLVTQRSAEEAPPTLQ